MVNNFLTALLVQILEEAQHRSLDALVFLSSWSPLYGMREQTRCHEAVAVVVGAFSAQMLRLLIAKSENYEVFASICAPISLWFLAVKAALNYRFANEYRAAQVANENAPPAAQEMQVVGAGKEELRDEELPTPAGEKQVSTATQPLAQEGLNVSPWQRGPVLVGYLVTLVTMFAVSDSDPMQGSKRVGEDEAAGKVGAVFGALAAASLAVLIGTLMEHVLSDRRFLLATSVVMGLSAVSATSHAILQFGFPQVDPA